MNRSILIDHLMIADRHIAEAAARVERQRALILRLDALGLDTSSAGYLLDSFERFEAVCVSDRDRLVLALGVK